MKCVLLLVLIGLLAFFYIRDDAKDVPLKDIEASLKEETELSTLTPESDRGLMQFIGLDAGSYEEVLYYKSSEALSVDEVLIIKAKSRDDLTGAEDAVRQRIDDQIAVFDSYGPEQVKELNNAIVRKKGNYLIYITAPDPSTYEEVILNAI